MQLRPPRSMQCLIAQFAHDAALKVKYARAARTARCPPSRVSGVISLVGGASLSLSQAADGASGSETVYCLPYQVAREG